MDDNDQLPDADANEPSIGSKPRRARKKAAEEKAKADAEEQKPEEPKAEEPKPEEPKPEEPKPAPEKAPEKSEEKEPEKKAESEKKEGESDGDASAGDDPLKKVSSIEDMDELLETIDPEFANDMKKIDGEDFKSLSIDEARTEQADENVKVKSFRLQWYHNLPTQVKIIYGGALAIFAFFVPLIMLVANKSLLPDFRIPYVLTMNEITDNVYTYDPEGPTVPLFDDFRSKAHTLALPRTTINLRSAEGQPAFGHFEFFLVVRDKELSKIIEGKRSEVIDLIQRTLEMVSWGEMQSPLGKEKVKKVLRHRINEYFQSNIVIGVYYRSILLSK